MRLVLLGPPGAGKGTIAKVLKDQEQLAHISTGDIFREEMKNNSDLGQELKSYVEKGLLVPDDVVTKIMKAKLSGDTSIQQGFMLDGFPRTKQQAEDLDQILREISCPLDYAIYMEATLPVILQRLTGRRVCKECGALYHIVNKPAKKADVCDECSGVLYQRPDDNEETIKTRMEVYLKSTAPIIDYYQQKGTLRKVNADKDTLSVQSELKKIFDEDRKLDQDKNAARD